MAHPLPNFHFKVEINDIGDLDCLRIRNLAVGTTPIGDRAGNSRLTSDTQSIGRQFFENFFLERTAKKDDTRLFDWWKETIIFSSDRQSGAIVQRDIVISLLNAEHEPVLTWLVINAFPVRLSWSDLDAKGNDALIEVMEIQCERIEIQT